ncbi:MAG: GNAT family N-acetyltransferase [Deltaproteobacteria bacterium]
MAETPELRTERLWLRPWRREDLEPFARLNADPRAMEYMPSLLSREQSDALVARITAHFAERGFGLWAVEVLGAAQFIGFVGLSVPRFEAAFTPCVEVGWRLLPEYWGRGHATEAGRAALAFGFEQHGLNEIVSFTTTSNQRSRAVMERLGMTRDLRDDFDHPSLPEGHVLRRHVLYRMRPAGSH